MDHRLGDEPMANCVEHAQLGTAVPPRHTALVTQPLTVWDPWTHSYLSGTLATGQHPVKSDEPLADPSAVYNHSPSATLRNRKKT